MLVGFIALAGVAVETAIVMLLYLNLAWEKRKKEAATERREMTLRDVEEVVFEGALLRVRPKVMTVATIFAALIPIMYGTGTGSEIMQRIAAPMVGGMATATLLTLCSSFRDLRDLETAGPETGQPGIAATSSINPQHLYRRNEDLPINPT